MSAFSPKKPMLPAATNLRATPTVNFPAAKRHSPLIAARLVLSAGGAQGGSPASKKKRNK
jgi:hypothetical protein